MLDRVCPECGFDTQDVDRDDLAGRIAAHHRAGARSSSGPTSATGPTTTPGRRSSTPATSVTSTACTPAGWPDARRGRPALRELGPGRHRARRPLHRAGPGDRRRRAGGGRRRASARSSPAWSATAGSAPAGAATAPRSPSTRSVATTSTTSSTTSGTSPGPCRRADEWAASGEATVAGGADAEPVVAVAVDVQLGPSPVVERARPASQSRSMSRVPGSGRT